MEFPYKRFPGTFHAADSSSADLQRPVLTVLLRKNGKAVTSLSLIDSGADFCMFPASTAKLLGISLPTKRKLVFSGTAGTPQIAYFERVEAKIWNGNESEAPITFELNAGFCESLEHLGMGLLGQDGFFSQFSVAFDLPSRLFHVG
jgi:hypothetical protein